MLTLKTNTALLRYIIAFEFCLFYTLQKRTSDTVKDIYLFT